MFRLYILLTGLGKSLCYAFLPPAINNRERGHSVVVVTSLLGTQVNKEGQFIVSYSY